MSNPLDPDSDAPYSLSPLDPQTEEARRRIRQSEAPVTAALVNQPDAPRWQFSLAQLLFANTILAAALAMLQWVAPSLLAGGLGVVAFTLFVTVWVLQPARPEVYAACWGLIVLYLIVAAAALWRG
jgi:hypothetical protein